ncbi:tetratricopeptide repeat protein [Bacteroidota bacterium]
MRRFSIFASFIAAALLIVSCGGPQKMADNASLVKYTVTPDPLEMHGGKVAVSVDVKYPEKYFHKKAIVTATPYLSYEGGETELKSETLQGEAVEDNFKVISYTSGGSSTYADEADYVPAMMRAELFVKGKAAVGSKEIDLPPVKLADGIVTTPLLADKSGETIAFGDNFKRIVPAEFVADIHYIINRYDVRNSELKADDIKGMKDFISDANANERIEMKGIEVSAYASPDGELDLNTKLSGNREGSATRFLKRDLKSSKVAVPEGDDFFKLLTTPEDWDGFKTLMEESDIQDKDLILRVLSMHSDPVVREKEIKNISEAFEEIKVDILPKLRRSVFTVNVEKVGWSDDEIKQWITENMDTLGLEELLYAASLVEDNETKLALYGMAWEKNPDCIRAANNVGVVKLAMDDVAGAKEALEGAKAIKDHNIVKNNLGVIALREGDTEAALNLFTSAMGAGDEVNQNLAAIKIQEGDYEAAKSYLGASESFNNALVILLNGQPGHAIEMLRKLDETAKTNYLIAVAAAREDDVEIMYNGLRAAVALKPAIKEHAVKDVEFFKYFEEDLFKEITQ